MQRSLAWRITAAYQVLILVVLTGLGLYHLLSTRASYLELLENLLSADAAVVAGEAAALMESQSGADLQPLALRVGQNSGARITLIAPDGTVLGDSNFGPAQLENHASRPEVQAALRGERGVALRHSQSVGSEHLYVAVPIISDGSLRGVARAAAPSLAASRLTALLLPGIVLALGATAATAGLLAVWVGGSVVAPIKRLTRIVQAMSEGRLEGRLKIDSRDEVGELGLAFNRMADRLQETIGAISAERNRLAAILETVADGLVIVDSSGRVLLLNPAAERLLGVNAAVAIGEPFIEVGRDHELVELLTQGNGGRRLVELGRPRRAVRAVAADIPDSSGQRVLLLQDVTEVRRLESVRRDFVANVSHELRTPLAAMKAIVETLEDGALDDPPAARAFLGRLHEEVDLLAELVRELMELSRIESGQARIRAEPVDLEPLLQSSVERLEPLAQRAGLELRLMLPPKLPPVLADQERIRQVLANLLHNAIKFTRPGGQVELRAEAQDSELAISVADTGVGIPPADLTRVFERFFKTDRSRSSGGTGLGLAIAKHIVQAHGGRIWAESDGAHGTTFTFTLPVVSKRPTPGSDAARLPGRGAATPTHGGL